MTEIVEVKKKRPYNKGVKHLSNKTGCKTGRKEKGMLQKQSKFHLEKLFELMRYGAKESKHHKAAGRAYMPYTPMSLIEACAEIGRTDKAMIMLLNRHPEYKERYEEMKELRREIIKSRSESVLEEAVSGSLDIEDKDVARLAFDVLKATDKAYNPKIEIEQNVKRLSLDMTDEEFKAKMLELINS